MDYDRVARWCYEAINPVSEYEREFINRVHENGVSQLEHEKLLELQAKIELHCAQFKVIANDTEIMTWDHIPLTERIRINREQRRQRLIESILIVAPEDTREEFRAILNELSIDEIDAYKKSVLERTK